MSAMDHALAMHPTKQAVRDLVGLFGYSVATLEPDFRDESGKRKWVGSQDYRGGARRTFVCSKKTDLSSLLAKVGPA